MIIKTPKFWFKNKKEINPLFFTLKPFSKIWEFVTKFRLINGLWEKMPIPVICIGNITVGGSGKTPVTIPLQPPVSELPPSNERVPDQTDQNGYEWINQPDGSKWYRLAGSQMDWQKYQ